MIKPTIGRVVWYWQNTVSQKQAHAAIVAYVHSDTTVNLVMFDENGTSTGLTSVRLYQNDGERPQLHFCEWMPYQREQAAKP